MICKVVIVKSNVSSILTFFDLLRFESDDFFAGNSVAMRRRCRVSVLGEPCVVHPEVPKIRYIRGHVYGHPVNFLQLLRRILPIRRRIRDGILLSASKPG